MHKLTSNLLILSLLWTNACQTSGNADIATKDAYRPVRENLQAKKPNVALMSFPSKEKGSFITTLERGWLNLIRGKADPGLLTQISEDLESSKTIFVSKEAKKFFLKESNGNDMPAEHEVIFLHVLTGLSYAQRNQPKEARVEAQRASRYLQGHYGDFAGDFDDPALRLMLGALWLYVGDWQHARVDLRVAAKLAKAYKWLSPIAENKTPPKNFVLALRGVGPEVVWLPGDEDSGRWGLKFVATEKAKNITVKNDSKKFVLKTPLHSMSWYTRHTDRDPPVRTFADDVRHGADVAAGITGAIVVGTLAALAAVTIIAGAVVISAGIIAVSGQVDSGLVDISVELSGHMIAGAAAIALNVASDGGDKAEGVYDDAADESQYYRYVRFLPTYFYAAAPKKLGKKIEAKFKEKQKPLLDLKSEQTRVLIFHSPQ